MVRSAPQKVSVIAHRGASSSAPENTVAAMMDATDAGADMIELDVQMTRDRRLVVFHDEGLGRTTNLHGVLASNHYSHLKDLDAENTQRYLSEIPYVDRLDMLFISYLERAIWPSKAAMRAS